jgi:NAD(P)-dependent dehydrogenase (short-subunit alcohol dehydrogenase family)
MDLGGLDALINNAGIRLRGGDGPVDRVSRATWDRTPAVNLTGAFLVRRHAIPGLLAARDSVIVNIASMAGLGSAIPAPTPTVPLKAA